MTIMEMMNMLSMVNGEEGDDQGIKQSNFLFMISSLLPLIGSLRGDSSKTFDIVA